MMKLRGSFHWLIMFSLLCGLAWFVLVAPVSAQAVTVLAVEPAQVDLPLGNQFLIELTVTDGVEISAFDIRLTYDQQRLALQSWAHGAYLGETDPDCDTLIKSPGLLELNCTQNNQAAASGDGVLLALAFDTRALGTAEIIIAEAVFTDAQGFQQQPDRINGLVNIQNLPTYTATPTITLTPTFTPTLTFTLTPLPPTETPELDLPTETATATLTPSPTETPTSGQATPDGGLTRTLTTPISGVAAPSRGTLDSGPGALTPSALGTGTAAALTQAAQTLASTRGSSATSTPESTQADGAQSAYWHWFLLGGLVVLGLGVILLILIRGKKHQEDGLLL